MTNLFRITKLFALVFFFILWFFVVVLVIESGLRGYEYIVSKTNPLILSLNNSPPWSDSKQIQLPAEPHSKPLPPPNELEWQTNRAKFFMQLDEKDRKLFADFNNLMIFIHDDQESQYKTYLSDTIEKNFNIDEQTLLHLFDSIPLLDNSQSSENCYSQFLPSFNVENDVFQNCLLFSQKVSSSQYIKLMWFQKRDISHPTQNEDTNNIWKIPFYEYQFHAQRLNSEFHTNNFGFRDEEIEIPKPTNVFRVICMGGSTTEEGPIEQETYPNYLEKMLMERVKEFSKIEVINAGIPGITINKLWFRIPDLLLMQPDLIIFCEGANDITHIFLPYWIKQLGGYKKWLLNSVLARDLFPLFFLPSDKQIRTDLQNDVLPYVDKIINYLKNKNIPLIIMSVPIPDYNAMTWQEKSYFQYVTRKWWGGRSLNFRMYTYILNIYNQLLREKTQDKGIFYVPLYEKFMNESPSQFNDLCHLKLKGIQKKAEIVSSYVAEKIQQIQSENK